MKPLIRNISPACMCIALAMTSGTTSAALTVITGTANGPNGSHDKWNNAANWNNGIPSGTDDAEVAPGVTAEAWNNATPSYSGSLTLGAGSTIQLGWTNPQHTNTQNKHAMKYKHFVQSRPQDAFQRHVSVHVSPAVTAVRSRDQTICQVSL